MSMGTSTGNQINCAPRLLSEYSRYYVISPDHISHDHYRTPVKALPRSPAPPNPWETSALSSTYIYRNRIAYLSANQRLRIGFESRGVIALHTPAHAAPTASFCSFLLPYTSSHLALARKRCASETVARGCDWIRATSLLVKRVYRSITAIAAALFCLTEGISWFLDCAAMLGVGIISRTP